MKGILKACEYLMVAEGSVLLFYKLGPMGSTGVKISGSSLSDPKHLVALMNSARFGQDFKFLKEELSLSGL